MEGVQGPWTQLEEALIVRATEAESTGTWEGHVSWGGGGGGGGGACAVPGP